MEYILYLTKNCNLKCKYCYEEKKISQSLNFDIVKHIMEKEIKSNDKITTIAFFGGEPLLQKQLIYDIVNYGSKLSKKAKHIFRYVITTNGTLLDDDFIKFCKKNQIAVGISIDGIKEVHNLNRRDTRGEGSFEVVEKNIKKCINSGLDCMALPTICLNNVEKLDQNVQYLIEQGFKKITCNFNYLDNWNDYYIEILKKQYAKISNIYYSEFKKKNYIRIYPLDTKILLRINKMKCEQSCARMKAVVDVNGDYYPCIQFVGNENYKIGNYIEGIDYEKKAKFLILKGKSNKICDQCVIKDRCIYKCGCARMMTTNDIIEVSPLICETERIYIEEADKLANRLYREFKDEFIKMNYNRNIAIL